MPAPIHADAVLLMVRCPLCWGAGRSDPRSIPGNIPCTRCAGTGRVETQPGDLTPEQATSLRALTVSAPPDGDDEYTLESSATNTRSLLTAITISHVEVSPNGLFIDLSTVDGAALRVTPSNYRGRFHHFNVEALPPAAERPLRKDPTEIV